MGREIEAAC